MLPEKINDVNIAATVSVTPSSPAPTVSITPISPAPTVPIMPSTVKLVLSTEKCLFAYIGRALGDAREFGWEFSDEGIYT